MQGAFQTIAKPSTAAAARKSPAPSAAAAAPTKSAAAKATNPANGPTFIVGYDGSTAADRALDFSASRARDRNGQVHVVYVLEWSRFSFLTQEELAERSKVRKTEMSRAEKFLQPVLKKLSAQGVAVSHEVRFGHAGELLCEIAGRTPGSAIVIGRTGGNAFTNRFLGSLVMTLVQPSPVPVTVVP